MARRGRGMHGTAARVAHGATAHMTAVHRHVMRRDGALGRDLRRPLMAGFARMEASSAGMMIFHIGPVRFRRPLPAARVIAISPLTMLIHDRTLDTIFLDRRGAVVGRAAGAKNRTQKTKK